MVRNHGPIEQEFRDFPHGEPTVLKLRRDRFKCSSCEHAWMENIPSLNDGRLMTRRLRQFIVKRCLKDTNYSVADDVGIDEHEDLPHPIDCAPDFHIEMRIATFSVEPVGTMERSAAMARREAFPLDDAMTEGLGLRFVDDATATYMETSTGGSSFRPRGSSIWSRGPAVGSPPPSGKRGSSGTPPTSPRR